MSDTSRQLPRGALYLSIGQAAFLLIGYALHAFLARQLTAAQYGVFGVTMVVLGWAEILVNNGVPSALQKFLPDRSLAEQAVQRAAIRCQILITVGVFLMLFAAAPLFAGLLRDPSLAGYLRLAFLDILAMGAYGYYRGVLNGWRFFRQLALTITFYSLTKLAAICALVLLGWGVEGALLGNVVSSLGGLAAGFFWTRRWRKAGNVPVKAGRAVGERELLAFVLPVVLFTLASNVLLGLDLMGVKALVADPDVVGFYSAAVNLANAPRLVLLAFSFALLPSLSHAIGTQDLAQTRHYLQQMVRLLALALLPILALVTATAEPLVSFVFSAPYRPAAPILTVLIFTYASYSIYITLVSALLAENRAGRALAIPLTLLPLAAGLVWLGLTWQGALGAAIASFLSVSIATIIVVGYVFRRFRPQVDVRSLARIALASVVLWGVGRLWSASGLALIVEYALLGGLYLAMLLILREIRPEDLVQMGNWFSGLKKNQGV